MAQSGRTRSVVMTVGALADRDAARRRWSDLIGEGCPLESLKETKDELEDIAEETLVN